MHRSDSDLRHVGICGAIIATQCIKHHIRFLDELRLNAGKNVVVPEVLKQQNVVLFLVQITLNFAPHEILFIVGEKASNVGNVNIHDAHVVTYLHFVMARHSVICPLAHGIVVRGLALENCSATIRQVDKTIDVCEHEWEQRVLIHGLIPEDGKAGLLSEDLGYNILQKMTNLEHDGLILVRLDGINSNLIVVQLSLCSVGRESQSGGDITAANAFAPVSQPFIFS